MELIKELQKQPNANNCVEEFRRLEQIKAGNYKLSIQGSSGHYCTPRTTVPVHTYSTMELAIMNKAGAMVNINRSQPMQEFKRYKELINRADSLNSSAPVYGYVSVDLLNDLYLFLKALKPKKQ